MSWNRRPRLFLVVLAGIVLLGLLGGLISQVLPRWKVRHCVDQLVAAHGDHDYKRVPGTCRICDEAFSSMTFLQDIGKHRPEFMVVYLHDERLTWSLVLDDDGSRYGEPVMTLVARLLLSDGEDPDLSRDLSRDDLDRLAIALAKGVKPQPLVLQHWKEFRERLEHR